MSTIQWGRISPSVAINGAEFSARRQTPIERLRAATRRLNLEMQNQRKSVTAFKQNIARLDKQMQILNKSCKKLNDTLAGVNVSKLSKRTRKLSKSLERC